MQKADLLCGFGLTKHGRYGTMYIYCKFFEGMFFYMTYIDPQALAARLDARAAEDLADCRIGGIGVCVAQGGKIICKKYFGCKSQATGEPLTDENGDRTIFRLASMSKPITAVATLIQVSRGLLDLDEPIETLLPEFAEMDIGELDADGNIVVTGRAVTKLTPRILLNHTNGVGSLEVGAKQIDAMTTEEMQDVPHVVECISRSVLGFEPASSQMYSPVWAFDVLARLIELTSEMDFASFLRENIFEPLGMTDTTFDPTAEQWSRMIMMHGREETDGVVRGVDSPMPEGCVFGNFPTTWASGGAGLASTMHDYFLFADMLRRGGVSAEGVRILPEELVREMGTCQVPEHIMPYGERWGLGVRVITAIHPWMPEGCFGWSGAYGTHFWIDPENDLLVILMRNSSYDGGAGAQRACNLEKDVYGYKD